ncbi:MAG: NACHT and WD repeat domain-containing protein [Pseudonocardiaceae bacterium]
MARKRSPLPVQVLLFLLVTLLGVAAGNLTNSTGPLPWGLEILRRQSLPLAGITVLLIIGVMVWQHRAEQPARPVWNSDRSPFPGLEAFTEQDSAVFFGRDAEITGLLDRLYPVLAGKAHRLVTVVGPSGAGKSSLVQAGVVPRLRQRRGGWIVVPPVVPGDHPLRSLARSLAAACPGHPVDGEAAARFADQLRTAARRPNAPVLLIVDQAEELIALSGEVERDRFLGLLAGVLDTDPRLWIIMIMRSEFLTAFLGTEQARLFRDPVTVGTLSRTALVEVIEQPARRAGLTFDPPTLPQRMAADAGGGDALPLLAYALQELCLAAGPGKPLTAGAYQRIGGVTGVLNRQADKVAAELGGTDPVLPTLLRFVTIGENEPTRRRVARSALTETQWRVAEAFITARLLTSDTVGDDAILEVAHEALFRSWAPLRQAIEASTDQLRWRADLERWAKDWEGSDRQDAYLLRDERLKAAQRCAASDGEVVDGLALVAEFLACSNRADRTTMRRLSETLARQALGTLDSDPDYSLLLALAAFEECAPTALAVRALTAVLVTSQLRAVLRGHDEIVAAVAWSPDGQRLATASSDRTARIWDPTSGSEIAALHGHTDRVWSVAWSPDKQRLATASGDRTVRIWDPDSGSEIAVLHGHNDWVRGVAWSPDGQHLATASSDRTIRIWDSHSGSEIAVLHGHNEGVRGVAWSPDGQRLATTSSDRTIRIWDPDSGSEIAVLHGHNDWVRGVAWSPDGQRLATGSRDCTARIWNVNSGGEIVVLHGHSEEVWDVAWSPDGERLATASRDHTARIWDTDAGSDLMTLRGHAGWVRGVAWSPDGQQLATASEDRTVGVWDTGRSGEFAVLYGHTGRVWGAAWSPDNQRLATASSDRTARIWDVQTGRELVTLRSHNGRIHDVAWSPDGQRLATASSDRTVGIWNANGDKLAALHCHDDEVYEVAWSPDGRQLATASRDRTARICDANDGSELAVLHGHDDEIWGVAWSPDGRRLATASNDRTVRTWDAKSGSEIAVLNGHDDLVACVAWSPDGRQLATASHDRTARIWDANDGSKFAVLRGHDGWVRGVTWSPDGQRLATASSDRTVRIWDAESGVEIIVVGAHPMGVESVSWSPDGTRVASASRDGTSRVWDSTVSIEDLVGNAHRRVSRELTAEERRNLMLPPTG